MADLARLIDLSVQAVSQWDEVPAERCLTVERVTGVSRHVLRPDIYGDDPGPFIRRKHSERRLAA